MLYWRTDMIDAPPEALDELLHLVEASGAEHGVVWQGARYEGLVTVFLEILTDFGGAVLTDDGRVGLDSPEARGALD